MASIVIKDLTENVELDIRAMRAITGGKSVTPPGIPSYHSSFFHKPLSFSETKLMPGGLDFAGPRW